jgi:hypothetical protein
VAPEKIAEEVRLQRRRLLRARSGRQDRRDNDHAARFRRDVEARSISLRRFLDEEHATLLRAAA